jgi:uncharacterized protein YjbI with pentapeptide repeats
MTMHRKSNRLRNADLRGAYIFADLEGADLRGADLRRPEFFGVNITGAQYDAATRWPVGFRPALYGAILVR